MKIMLYDNKGQEARFYKLQVAHHSGINPSVKSNLLENKICIPGRNRIDVLLQDEILYCNASSNYTEIIMVDGKKHVVSKTLAWVEEKLTQECFIRVHQSYVINLNYVTGLSRSSSYQLEMEGIKQSIPVSRSNQKMLNAIFE